MNCPFSNCSLVDSKASFRPPRCVLALKNIPDPLKLVRNPDTVTDFYSVILITQVRFEQFSTDGVGSGPAECDGVLFCSEPIFTDSGPEVTCWDK